MRLAIAFMLTAALVAAAARWDSSSRRSDVVFINRGDVFTLDPQRMSYLQDFRIGFALYEGLLRLNNHNLSIEPAAASLPEVSDDGLVYTFHLRPEARWSNGEPVTAHDFVYSWKRLLWPDTAADYSNFLFVIEGAAEFFSWRNAQLASFATEMSDDPAARRARAELLMQQAEARFDRIVGLRALDESTLQVRLRRPTAYFPELVCFPSCLPVHRPTVEGWTDPVGREGTGDSWSQRPLPPWSQRRWLTIDPVSGRLEQKHDWARPGALVGNGPYALDDWRYKRDLRLVRNTRYRDQDLLRNDSVTMVSIDDPGTAVLAFESGGVDWLNDVTTEYMADMLDQRRRYEERYRTRMAEMALDGMTIDECLALLPEPDGDERRNVHALPTFGTDFYGFNCRPMLPDGRPNPFAVPAVRRAFAMSVDKAAIVQAATRLNEPVLDTLIPPGSIPGYPSPQGLVMDVAQARQELALAGWRDRDQDGLIESEAGEPFPVIDLLWTTGSPRYKWMSLELKAQWERALGVRIELRGVDTKFYKDDLKHGKYMIARGRWYGDYSDPTTFLDINRTGDGNNDRGFTDAAFDAMLDAAAAERDPAARLSLLADAEAYLMSQQAPLVPICQLVQLYMYEPGRIDGLTRHPRLVQYLWQLRAVKDT